MSTVTAIELDRHRDDRGRFVRGCPAGPGRPRKPRAPGRPPGRPRKPRPEPRPVGRPRTRPARAKQDRPAPWTVLKAMDHALADPELVNELVDRWLAMITRDKSFPALREWLRWTCGPVPRRVELVRRPDLADDVDVDRVLEALGWKLVTPSAASVPA
jgi:hypothetical protein